MTQDIKTAALAASDKWQATFNAGNGEGCADFYEEDALMVAAPFGEFRGRAAIRDFWNDLVAKGFADVTYIDRKVEVLDDTAAVISAGWTMNHARGVITKELWVLQHDGRALLREDFFEAQE